MTFERFALIAVLVLSPAMARPDSDEESGRHLQLVNSSTGNVAEVYVSRSTNSLWGPNLLKQSLAAGSSTNLSLKGRCGTYDVRIVGDGGFEYIATTQRMCPKHDVITLTDQGLTIQAASGGSDDEDSDRDEEGR